MKKYLSLLMCVGLLSCVNKKEADPSISDKNSSVTSNKEQVCKTTCKEFDKNACYSLYQEYGKCNSTKKQIDCEEFVLAFSKALPKTIECTNTCSDTPFKMAISYGCDELNKSMITESSAHLLSKLKFKSAQQLFLSNEFHSILDGALAEDILPEIEKIRKLKK